MTTYLVTTLSMDFSVHPADRVQALPADYCEFRLCMTPADYGRRQRHRANPIPLSIIYERSLSVKEKNKNIILSFRVTPEEKTWIEEHSYGHYRRISDFVRDCIFKKEIVNIDGADEIAHELQRIGNNLNQLTRAVNAGFVRAVDLGETKQEVQKVWQSLNSLLRDAR